MTVGPEKFTVWHGLLLAEGAAALIALIMPITPSKTGSNGQLAELFIADPSYLHQVSVYFVLNNLLLLLLGVVSVIWLKLKRD